MKEKNKGITLISLVVTIIVLLILSGIGINMAIQGLDSSKSKTLEAELETVQHAIIERYTKYKLTKNEDLLVGTVVTPEALVGESWDLTQGEIGTDVEKKYRQLDSNDLKELGLEAGSGKLEDTYIVNYSTGEVYNVTVKTTPNGKLLYKSLQ